MKNLTITKKRKPASLEEIESFETKLKTKLPMDYCQFLNEFNPISTLEVFYTVYENEYWLSNFYPLDSNYEPSLESTWENLKDFFKGDYLAFADDAGGWQFVMSLKKVDYGKIYFCRLDEEIEKALTLLALSFSEFIEKLEKDDARSPSDDIDNTSAKSKNIRSKEESFVSGLNYFEYLLDKYNMDLILEENYKYGAAKIIGDKCMIELSMDRYTNDFDIYFINPINNKQYHYGLIMRRKEVFKNEKSISQSRITNNEEIREKLKNIAYLMDKYCSDILTGDFSNVEDLNI